VGQGGVRAGGGESGKEEGVKWGRQEDRCRKTGQARQGDAVGGGGSRTGGGLNAAVGHRR